MGFEINFKQSGQANFAFEAEGCATIKELREKIETELPDKSLKQKKLFFKGRMLGDDDKLEDRKIVAGATILLVKSAVDKSAAAAEPEKKKEDESPAVSVRCKCGFWGSSKTGNMCSKCYKEEQEKEAAALKEKLTKKDDAENEEKKKAEEEEEKKKEEERKNRPVQENKTRCWTCQKKCGLTGIECRCGYVFCDKHRLPEDHDCDFDYKSCGRELLRKQNNKVEADKLGDRL